MFRNAPDKKTPFAPRFSVQRNNLMRVFEVKRLREKERERERRDYRELHVGWFAVVAE